MYASLCSLITSILKNGPCVDTIQNEPTVADPTRACTRLAHGIYLANRIRDPLCLIKDSLEIMYCLKVLMQLCCWVRSFLYENAHSLICAYYYFRILDMGFSDDGRTLYHSYSKSKLEC